MDLRAPIPVNVIGGALIYGTGGLLALVAAPMLGLGAAGIAAWSTAAAAGSIILQLNAAARVAPMVALRP